MPSSRKRSVNARPIPLAAPVTTTTLSLISMDADPTEGSEPAADRGRSARTALRGTDAHSLGTVSTRSFRLTPDAYRRICGVALALLAVIVVTGAAVRLTGSGLGCSDWPTCEEDRFVPEADFHGWVEFGNRLLTGLVSVAVIGAVLGSMVRRPRRRDLEAWSWGLVAGVVAQVLLGGIVVLSHLNPWLVLGHFALSMVLVANAVLLHHRAGDHDRRDGPATDRVRRLTVALVGLAMVVLATGTLVTGSGPHRSEEHTSELQSH